MPTHPHVQPQLVTTTTTWQHVTLPGHWHDNEGAVTVTETLASPNWDTLSLSRWRGTYLLLFQLASAIKVPPASCGQTAGDRFTYCFEHFNISPTLWTIKQGLSREGVSHNQDVLCPVFWTCRSHGSFSSQQAGSGFLTRFVLGVYLRLRNTSYMYNHV